MRPQVRNEGAQISSLDYVSPPLTLRSVMENYAGYNEVTPYNKVKKNLTFH